MHIVLYANEPWQLPDAAVDPQQHHMTSLHGNLADLPRRVVGSGPDLVLVRGFEHDETLIGALEKLCIALPGVAVALVCAAPEPAMLLRAMQRSEEHTSELQSRFGISYAVFCLKKKKKHNNDKNTNNK